MNRSWRIAPILALPALIGAYLVLGAGVSAETPAKATTLNLKELEKGSTFTHIRNTESASQKSNLQGDLIVFTNRVADSSGAVIGKLSVSCVTTTGAQDFTKSVATCTGVLVLQGGTLAIVANTSPGKSTTSGAVTGGTGTYANARGVFLSKEVKGGSLDTITLAG
jgi:hypothetical protein